MPGRDRSGPMGSGPMTGRGAGFCAGYSAPGFGNENYFRGGRGRRNNFYGMRGLGQGFLGIREVVSQSPESKKEILTKNADILRKELSFIQNQLTELDESDSNE